MSIRIEEVDIWSVGINDLNNYINNDPGVFNDKLNRIINIITSSNNLQNQKLAGKLLCVLKEDDLNSVIGKRLQSYLQTSSQTFSFSGLLAKYKPFKSKQNTSKDELVYLLYAINNENEEAAISYLKYLKSKGVDLDQKDDLGRTPLHWACASGCKKAVIFLMKEGLSLLVKDYQNKNCIQLAYDFKQLSLNPSESVVPSSLIPFYPGLRPIFSFSAADSS